MFFFFFFFFLIGLQKIRSLLLENLDDASWKDLSASLAKANTVPNLDQVLQEGNCWHDAAVVVMGIAPELSWTQQMGLHSLGLSDVVSLFKSAKEIRRKKQLRAPVSLSKDQQEGIDSVMDELAEVLFFSFMVYLIFFSRSDLHSFAQVHCEASC
jgi:hypothetical protein